jgi:hypothetical protein
MNTANTKEILKIQILCDIMDALKEIERLIIEKERTNQNFESRLNDLYKKYDSLNRQFRELAPIIKD